MIYLGIDGGGSKTTFLLMEDEHEVARVQSGPSNWLSVGSDAATQAIREGAAQLSQYAIDSVCGGFAGAGRREGVQFYRGALSAAFPQSRIRVESDAFISYVGAIGLNPGVLLIAGTGSIAIARKHSGVMIRAGGWGPIFGDEGSGFWIGREAIRAALRSLDMDADVEFGARIAAKLGLSSIRDVPANWASGSIRVPDVAALVPELTSLWPKEPAAGILRAAAAHLKQLVETASRAGGVHHSPVCASGSVAALPLIAQLIAIPFSPAQATPEAGAVLLAREQHQK